MASNHPPSGDINQPKTPRSSGVFGHSFALSFATLTIIIFVTLFYLFAPKLIRKYAKKFKIGQIGFLSLKELEWRSHHTPCKDPGTPRRSGFTSEEDEADQAVRITIKSIGLRLGSNESSRRQWIALRVDSPHIRVPKPRKRSNSFDSSSDSSEPELSSPEASYRYECLRKISAASSISQLSGLSKSDAPQSDFLTTLSRNSTQATSSILRHLPPQARPAIRFLRKLLRLARLEIVRPLLNKLNRFGRRLSWIISVFGVEVNDIQVDVNEICRVTCSIKTGLQLSRGDDGKICCWIVIKKLQVHKVTPFDHSASPSKEDIRLHHTGRDTTAAFSFPGCIEISASAGLDPVIGLASIWAGTKSRGYNRQAFYSSSMSDGSWKRYIRPRSVNIALKISDDLQAVRRTSKKTSLFPNLKASSAFISIENGLAIMRAIPHRTKTEDTEDASPSIPIDEPMFPSSNFSHLEEPEHSPSNVFSIVSIIREFQISLPSFHCYYILSGPIPSPNPTSFPNPGPGISQNKRVAIDLQITRFLMNLDLSAEKSGKESSRSGRNLVTHMEWFGRGTPIPLRLDSQWKDVIINATLVPNSESPSDFIPNGPTQLLRMSDVSFILSSSWAPRGLNEKIESANFSSQSSHINLSGDHNSQMIVAEFDIGKIRGQMPIDNLLIMLLLSQHDLVGTSKAHSAPPPTSQDSNRPRQNRPKDAPKFVFGLSMQSLSYELHGPTGSSSALLPSAASQNPVNSNIGSSSRAANVLSFKCSSFHFNSEGEYIDFVVKRSDAARRAARSRARRNEVYVPTSLRGIHISQAHDQSVLLEKRPSERDSTSTYHEVDTYSVKLPDETYDKTSIGPHPQAFPLPNNSLSSIQWKSKVDVFREKSSVDFFYRLSFTWQTHSIDVGFQDDSLKFEKSRHPFASFDLPPRISSPGSCDIFSLKTVEITSEFCFAGRNIHGLEKTPVPTIDLTLREGTVQTLIEEVSCDLWRPNVLASLVAFNQAFKTFRRESHHPKAEYGTDTRAAPLPRTVPIPRDIAFSIAASKFSLRVAGFDPKRDSKIARGTQVIVCNALIECFRQSSAQPGLYISPYRMRLDLREDIRVHANAQLLQSPEFESCLLKCAMKKVEIIALPDLTGALRSRFSRLDSPSRLRMFHYRSPSLWDEKARFDFQRDSSPQSPIDSILHEAQDIASENQEVPILEVNRLACRTTLQILKPAETGEEELILAVETGLINSHVDAFHIYCALISISTLLNLAKKLSSHETEGVQRSPESSNRLPIGIRAEFSRINCHVFLSHQVPIFVEMRRVSLQKSSKLGIDARWDTLLLAGRSVTSPGRWDELVKVKTCKVKLIQTNASNSTSDPALLNRGWHPFVVLIEGDAARLRIPFKFIIAEVIENVSLLAKTTKQLVYQFIRGGTESVLQPTIEDPKKLPEIRIKFRIVCVQAEDDPFENKLNAIRRAGKEEVKDRLARNENFEQRFQGVNGPKKTPQDPKCRYSWDSHRPSERSSSDSPRIDDSSSFQSSYLGRIGTQSSHVPIGQAGQRLDEYNGAAWIKRIRNALAEQERQEDAIQRQLYGHTATKLTDVMPVPMVPVTKATPLLRVVFNSIRIAIYKADFDNNEDGLMNYLHEVGKGLPKDTKFSLIVPMHISWQMEGATIRLRDFPLYLFSLPRPQAQNGHQLERDLAQYTWQFESDFVIAEEMCGIESVRAVQSVVIPPHHSCDGNTYTLDIPKSVMPVKSYANPFIKIKSTAPVQLGWGNSMQPTVQDMMRVLDSLSKPPVDLSERVGFWDKVRLVLHWRVDISFMGSKADVVLHLKGSRDPYELLGSGAGFVKVWRGNVKILLGHQNDEQEFLQIKSDQFILGIPNLKDHINNAATGSAPVATATPAANYKRVYQSRSHESESDESDPDTLSSRETEFIKIVGKLTNGVRWGMGIVLERACSDNLDKSCSCSGPAFHRKCRLFTFKPHYQVVTKTPQYGRSPDGSPADSYEGFRSDFIHFSISLTSPTESGSRQKRPTGQNSLYFSAESFTHFWCWWKTFDSALALPIRQGNLFPSAQAPSKKFGRHVATIKYRFGISPLFLAHTYRYESAPDWVNGKNVVLGFKAKISTFNVDLHSRAVETTIRKPEMKEPKKLIRKAFYQAEIECQDVNVRALSAVFQTPRKSTYANDIGLTADQDESETNSIWEDSLEDESEFLINPSGEEGDFSIYSNKLGTKDMEWLDLNDFSDIFFWPNSSGAQQPKIKMFDCLSCPRISFLRRPSSVSGLQVASTNNNASDGDSISDGQPIDRTKFGKEDTHTCFIGKSEDPMKVQVGLIDARLKELDEKKYRCLLTAGSYHPQRPEDTKMLLQIDARMQTLRRLKATMLKDKRNSNLSKPTEDSDSQVDDMDDSDSWADGERFLFEMANQISDENSEWSNRLLVHNPSILISNSIRDILLKYYYSSSQRRAFMYHISARAVKFILDLAEQESSVPTQKPKHDFNKRKSRLRSFDYQKFDTRPNTGTSAKSHSKFPNQDYPATPFRSLIEEQAEQDVPDEFILDPANLILLLRPQIAFRSEVDDISTVILTAFHAQFKSFDVLDPSHIDDPVNATVMKRNFGTVKGFQMFYPCNSSVSCSLYSPPGDQEFQVPIEVLVDLRLEAWGFDRLIGRCTVNIANDAFNQLRIKRRSAGADGSFSSATQPHLQTLTDLLRVEMADAVSVHATATHYRAIYNVITDLCLYIDPAQKRRNAALETMQFAYDVDDLEGMAEQIQQQQAQIRSYRNKLDEGYVDLNLFDDERMAALTQCEYQLWIHASDLNLMVEAIRRSQAGRLGRSKAEKLPGSQLSGQAKSITWHMLTDTGEAIAKLSVTDTRFESYTLPDTSVSNRLYVQDMLALNISADSDRQFDEILSRYEPYSPFDPVRNSKQFLMVLWKTLPPVAGISIIESFLLEIHPIRLQVEHAIGVKVHDYLFAHKSAAVDSENDSDEQSNSMETLNTSIVEGEMKKLNKKRSMLLNLHQPKNRAATPDILENRRRTRNFSSPPSQESLIDLPLTVSGRSRTTESSGFLNPDWRASMRPSPSAFGKVTSSRTSRAASVRSNSSDGRHQTGSMNATPTVLMNWNKQKTEDASEMKKRAQLYKSFLFIDVAPTILCVSYSGPKYPDIYDLVVKVPPFHFESRTWSYSEFFDEIRRTCVSSLFKQSPSILGQIITTARKNKSVPKLMGQKMASGFKFKKRNLFERGSSTPTVVQHTSRGSTSSTIAGTSIDQGSSGTSQDTSLSPSLQSLHSPYLNADSSSTFGGYHVPRSKESTPRPSFFNHSHQAQPDYSHSSNQNSPNLDSSDLESSEFRNDDLQTDTSPPSRDQRSRSHGRTRDEGGTDRRQPHMRLSASDASDFNQAHQFVRKRRQSEGQPSSRPHLFTTTEPMPTNRTFFTHSSSPSS